MIIKTTKEIHVRNNIANTFRFFADPTNDPRWRKEINQTKLSGSLRSGVLAYEYSRLSSRKSNNLAVLQCAEFIANNKVVFQSAEDAKFYLKSVRTVERVSDGETKIIYHLEFETAIVKFALGFPLPKFLIAWKARADMKKYLSKLKWVLESRT